MNANTTMMRQVNKTLVRRSLKEMRKATKHELAMRTGLSVVTLHSLLTEMIESHEVTEGETVPSGGGRPGIEYHFNADYAYALIVYGYQRRDTNFIKFATVNLFGEKVWEEELYLTEVEIDSFDGLMALAFEKYPEIRRIGVGIPGEAQGDRITMCDYTKLVGTGFAGHIRERFRRPLLLMNDVNAAIAGFIDREGCGPGECSVGLYFPRVFAPGAGMAIGGEIYTGKDQFAGELGFLPMGNDWVGLDYNDRKLVTEKIGELVSIYCCILAPRHMILYGDFLDEGLLRAIKESVSARLGNKFTPDIYMAPGFEPDYEKGMIREVLANMEDNYELILKGV